MGTHLSPKSRVEAPATPAPEGHAPPGRENGAPAGLPLFLQKSFDNAELQAGKLGIGETPVVSEANSELPPAKPPGTGEPLPQSIVNQLQPQTDADLKDVRVHTGGAAAEMARSYAARAYTAGRDIVFGGDRFAPDSTEGRDLLMHELVHVGQQSAAGRTIVQRDIDDELENTTIAPDYAKQFSPEELDSLIESVRARALAEQQATGAPSPALQANLATLENAALQSCATPGVEKNVSAPGISVPDLQNPASILDPTVDPAKLKAQDEPVVVAGLAKEACLADYTRTARQMLVFRLDAMYQWTNIVVRSQIATPQGEGSEQAAKTLRDNVPQANGLAYAVWNAKALAAAYDDFVSEHVPPEDEASPKVTDGSIAYIRQFSNAKLQEMGYPAEFPDFPTVLDQLGFAPPIPQEELDKAAKAMGFDGASDPYAKSLATDAITATNPKYKPKAEDKELLDNDAHDHRGYSYLAFRTVAIRYQTAAHDAVTKAQKQMNEFLDQHPLLRMYISDWSVIGNEFLPGSGFHDLIDAEEITAQSLIPKLDKLLEDLSSLRSKVASDDDMLFDSAIGDVLEPLVAQYGAVDPQYADWIHEKFASTATWSENVNLLLTVGAMIGGLMAELLSGGLATAGVATAVVSSVALAAKSKAKAGTLTEAAHAGMAGIDQAAVAEFQAWLDTAMALFTVGPLLARPVRALLGRIAWSLRGGETAVAEATAAIETWHAPLLSPEPVPVWQAAPRTVDPATGDLVVLVHHAPTDSIFELRFNPATGEGSMTHLESGTKWIISGGKASPAPPVLGPVQPPSLAGGAEPAGLPPAPVPKVLTPAEAGIAGEETRLAEVDRPNAPDFRKMLTARERARLYGMIKRGEITLKEFAEMLGRKGAQQVYFRTPLGRRWIDHLFLEGDFVVLRESKNVSDFVVTADIELQLQKDLYLLDEHPEARVSWRISGNGRISPEAYNLLEGMRETNAGRFTFQLQDSALPDFSAPVSQPPTLH